MSQDQHLVRAAVLLAVAACVTPTAAQDTTPANPSFEVASVRPNTSGLIAQSSQIGNGAVTLTNMRVRAMLVNAYRIDDAERIVGLPSWTDQERFDINAKAPAGTPDAQLRLMLQTLLKDRFQLVVHAEMRDHPVYALVVRTPGTLGPNLKPSTECDARPVSSTSADRPAAAGNAGPVLPTGRRLCTVITGSDGKGAYITGGARTIDALVRGLQRLTDRPVVDRTGLTGTYDFDVRFAAASLATPPTDVPELPSIFTAIQEQLGLRLEPARGPVEFLVVERIERPTPN